MKGKKLVKKMKNKIKGGVLLTITLLAWMALPEALIDIFLNHNLSAIIMLLGSLAWIAAFVVANWGGLFVYER